MNPKKVLALIVAASVLCSPAWAALSKRNRKNPSAAEGAEAQTPVAPAPQAEQPAIQPAAQPVAQPAAQAPTPSAQPAPAPLLPAAAPKAEASLAPSSPVWQGMKELSASLAYVFTDKISDTMNLRGRAGIFYTRDLSLGATLATTFHGKDSALTLLFTPQYHFPTGSQFLPYAEGRLGLGAFRDNDGGSFSGLGLGAGVGVKYYRDKEISAFFQIDDTHYFGGKSFTAIAFSAGVSKSF